MHQHPPSPVQSIDAAPARPARFPRIPGVAKAITPLSRGSRVDWGRTYQCDSTRDEHRPRKDEDAPRKEDLHRHRHDGAHDRDEEPPVVDLRETLDVAVVVHEDLEGDSGDKSSLDPLEHQHGIY